MTEPPQEAPRLHWEHHAPLILQCVTFSLMINLTEGLPRLLPNSLFWRGEGGYVRH